MNPSRQIEFYRFAGAGAMNGTLDNEAAANQSANYEPLPFGLGVVRIPITGHGLIAGANKYPTHVYIQGSVNYNGLRRIVAIPGVDDIDIAAKFVAETFSGSETYRVAVSLDEPWEFCGFDVHVDAAPATSANLVVSKDSVAGTYWDVNYFTEDMNTVQDWSVMWDEPILVSPGDVVYATWANANGDDWGFEFKIRRLS